MCALGACNSSLNKGHGQDNNNLTSCSWHKQIISCNNLSQIPHMFILLMNSVIQKPGNYKEALGKTMTLSCLWKNTNKKKKPTRLALTFQSPERLEHFPRFPFLGPGKGQMSASQTQLALQGRSTLVPGGLCPVIFHPLGLQQCFMRRKLLRWWVSLFRKSLTETNEYINQDLFQPDHRSCLWIESTNDQSIHTCKSQERCLKCRTPSPDTPDTEKSLQHY